MREQRRLADDAERQLQSTINHLRQEFSHQLKETLEQREQRRRQRAEKKRLLSADISLKSSEEVVQAQQELEKLKKEEDASEEEDEVKWRSTERMRMLTILGTEMVSNMALNSGRQLGLAATRIVQMLAGDVVDTGNKDAQRGSARSNARSANSKWRKDINLSMVEFLVDLKTIIIDPVVKYQLFNLFKTLLTLPEAEPFSEPVDPVALNIPDYFNIVKQPMDLGTIFRRLLLDEYATLQDVVTDMELMCKNCHLYNGPQSPVTQLCNRVEVEFIRGLVDKIQPVIADMLLNEEKLLQSYIDEQKRLERERKAAERQAEKRRLQEEYNRAKMQKREHPQPPQHAPASVPAPTPAPVMNYPQMAQAMYMYQQQQQRQQMQQQQMQQQAYFARPAGMQNAMQLPPMQLKPAPMPMPMMPQRPYAPLTVQTHSYGMPTAVRPLSATLPSPSMGLPSAALMLQGHPPAAAAQAPLPSPLAIMQQQPVVGASMLPSPMAMGLPSMQMRPMTSLPSAAMMLQGHPPHRQHPMQRPYAP